MLYNRDDETDEDTSEDRMPTKTSPKRKAPSLKGTETVPPHFEVHSGLSLSEAIREAFKTLGDPDAPASRVRKVVLEAHPSFAKMVENEKNWNSYVSQNRDKAAEEMGVSRRSKRKVSGVYYPPTITYADFQAAQEFIADFGGGDADKAVALLEKLANWDIPQLRRTVDAWLRLVESVGSTEAARRAIETMKEMRSMW